ncbi:MAG: cytochrome c, partial [Sneathiella sp.]|nr:cytochrome c [Sneathiella sp.]
MNGMFRKSVTALLIGGFFVVGITNAHSESTGNADADHRIGEMKKMGMNLGAIAKVAKGEMAFSDALNANAKVVAEVASNLAKLFPEGSGLPEVATSRAKPDIWEAQYKDAFQKDIENLQAASTQLVAAVQSGDQA